MGRNISRILKKEKVKNMAEIKIEHVTKKFKDHVVVDDVSMKLESGTVTGLKGINGSGKTKSEAKRS